MIDRGAAASSSCNLSASAAVFDSCTATSICCCSDMSASSDFGNAAAMLNAHLISTSSPEGGASLAGHLSSGLSGSDSDGPCSPLDLCTLRLAFLVV